MVVQHVLGRVCEQGGPGHGQVAGVQVGEPQLAPHLLAVDLEPVQAQLSADPIRDQRTRNQSPRDQGGDVSTNV